MSGGWPVTGRAEELRLIDDALLDGERSGVVIAGEAGVGKTRLSREAADAMAASGWAVSRVTGTLSGHSVPLGAFAPWTDDRGAAPTAMARQVVEGLRASAGGAPLLLVVDDAHLLDDLSAMVLNQLVMQGIARAIATMRTGEPAPDAVTTLWKGGALRRLELQPLSRQESDMLLLAALGDVSGECADRMWKLTRGNVLYLRHLVEQEQAADRLVCRDGHWIWNAESSMSPTLVDLVELHIGAVPAEARDVVDLVAVAEPIDRFCLAALADSRSVEEAEARGLIKMASDSDLVYVGHPLYGEVRLAQCGPLRLRRLRGDVATAMARSEDPDPLRLGMLWLDSDLSPDPHILASAAAIARSRLDLPLAERLARAAVEAGADIGTQMLLAYVLFLREQGEDTERLLGALGTVDRPDTGFVSPEVLRSANLLWVMRCPGRAREVIDEAIAADRRGSADHLRTFLAVQQVLLGDPAGALDTMATVDQQRLDPFGRILGLCAQVIASGDLGRLGDAVAMATAGYAVLGESPQAGFQGTGLSEFHAWALLAAGYVEDAVVVAEERNRLCAGLPGLAGSMATATVGMTALAKGELPTAVRCLGAARAGLDGYGERSGIFYRFKILYAEALARSGEIDEAVAAMDDAREGRHPAYAFVESGYLLAAAWVAAVRGRAGEARQLATQAAEFARRHCQPAREVMSLQTAVQLGDPTVADRLAELAESTEGPRAAVAARYAHALAGSDGPALDDVARDFEAMGDRLAAADAAAQATVSYRRAGLRGSALSAAAHVRRLTQACGGAVSPALGAAKVTLPFTEREREIAVLVSQGLSNRDIAEAMSLSVRTVEGHIYRATLKAGGLTRAELSSVVSEFM